MAAPLTFEPLYLAERLHQVNPAGDVGLVTLWTPRDTALAMLEGRAPELLDPEQSRIAVVSNLYGDGMYRMLCNILHNPQIRHLVAVGQTLDQPTCDEIRAFLDRGVEEGELLGRPVLRVRGTQRVLHAGEAFDAERLRAQLSFHQLGRLKEAGTIEGLRALLEDLPCEPPAPGARRVVVPIDEEAWEQRPSDVGAHQVVRRTPVACWRELVVRVMRFGRPASVGDGVRLELLNVTAVIEEPVEEPSEVLERYGFSLAAFHDYQRKILSAERPDEVSYTYGNRLRGHFRRPDGSADTLAGAIAALRAEPATRRAFVSLWDDTIDLALPGSGSPPCLVTLVFRRDGERLGLTATYRSHNLLKAWLENVYGLIAIQRHVAQGAGMEPGRLTVISHSLGADPDSPRIEVGRAVADGWKSDNDVDEVTGRSAMREDPNGYFAVSVDRAAGEIVAQHRFEGLLLHEYRGPTADAIAKRIARDMGVSLISHALWLGQELQRHEALLRAR